MRRLNNLPPDTSAHTEKFRKNMKISLGIFCGLFVLLIGFLGFSVMTEGDEWFSSHYNPRLHTDTNNVIAGSISESGGKVLAWSDENFERHYIDDSGMRHAMSHVIGDTHGKSVGAESIFSNYLYQRAGIFEEIGSIGTLVTEHGSDITLTVDADLSEYIYDEMKGYTGSVVLLNYETGELISSVSRPTFDPETVATDELTDSELVDRATMGRYPPGSTMKIITTVAAYELGIDITYECSAHDIIAGQNVTCVEEHGINSLTGAFAHSCNTYYANLALEIGDEKLMEVAERFGFNMEFDLEEFALYPSNFETGSNDGDLAWASIGQLYDLATPMHMAMITAAIANDGVMMEPKMLASVSRNGEITQSFSGEELMRVCDIGAAQAIEQMMLNTVALGTASRLQISGYDIAAKTGTAEFEDENGDTKNHSWVVAYIDDPEHPYAIAVILEGAGFGSAHAVPLAQKIFSKML